MEIARTIDVIVESATTYASVQRGGSVIRDDYLGEGSLGSPNARSEIVLR